MIPVPAFLAGKVTGKAMLIGGVVLLVVAVLFLTYCTGRNAGKSGEVVEQQEREIEVQKDIGEANTKAGDVRVLDAVEREKQKKEIADALAATNDPDRQRALRGCVILRQQGRDTSGIAACSGS